MNHKTKGLIRRAICSLLISMTIITFMYNSENYGAKAHNENIETEELNNDDSDVARKDSTIEIDHLVLKDDTECNVLPLNYSQRSINVPESIVEQKPEEVIAEVNVPVIMVTSPSETVLSEVVISDEEKWTAVTNLEEPYTMYCNITSSYLNVRSGATSGIDNIIGGLHYADEVKVIGRNTYDESWSAIEYKGKTAFVYSKYLSEWVDTSLRVASSSNCNKEWDGTKLNSKNGKIQGPSGTETYYNLKMDRCIYYMNQLGYNYNVWTRDDGVKMFGDYVMVAANLDIRPKGSLVETSLGTGIVVDTGEFVNYDSTGIDIAVTW